MHFSRLIVAKFTLAIVLVLGLALTAPALAARHGRAQARQNSDEEDGGEHVGRRGRKPAVNVDLSQIHVLGDRPAPFALDAHAAILIDARSNAVLYAYNEHQRMQPASLAKMMTFYIAMQALAQKRITLDTQMPISETAWRLSLNSGVSRMFLQVGERVAVHDLLYGLMVSSGNDAAVVLAEYLAGSGDAFAQEMNKQATAIGLTETHFTNPDGLPTDDEYTTAADMAKLGRTIITTFPEALTYTSAKEFTFDKIRQRNFNTLLFYDSRVNGIKTGHVEEAGYHLVASARAENLQLVSAVMGTPSPEKRRVETDKLLDWAFRTFTTVSPDWHKAAPTQLRVYKGDVEAVPIAPAGEGTTYFTIGRGMERKVELAATLPTKPLVAPIPKGTAVGQLTVTINGKPESSTPLVTQDAVRSGNIFHNLADSIRLKL